jgi:hypothetical protein
MGDKSYAKACSDRRGILLGHMLPSGRSRVLFPKKSLDFSIDLL